MVMHPWPFISGRKVICLRLELREGKQHCQKDTPALLARVLRDARRITDQPILVRLDGGNDSIDNIDIILEHNQNQTIDEAAVDFIIKWNPRRVDKDEWLKTAEQQGCWAYPREGKRTAIFSETVTRTWKGYDYQVRRVIRISERTIDKHGQILLIPEQELEPESVTSLRHRSQALDYTANSKQIPASNNSPPVNLPPMHSCWQ